MATLLDAINCGYKLDAEKFQLFCDSWLDRFFASHISWNVLSPYCHLILYHGADLIRQYPVATGLQSEEGR